MKQKTLSSLERRSSAARGPSDRTGIYEEPRRSQNRMTLSQGRDPRHWEEPVSVRLKDESDRRRHTEISRKNVVTRYIFCVRKSLSGNIYGSFAPNKTLLAKFCTTFAISKRPRRISFEGGALIKPSTSGATMAGQKNRRKIKAPTAVNLASGNLFITAVDI